MGTWVEEECPHCGASWKLIIDDTGSEQNLGFSKDGVYEDTFKFSVACDNCGKSFESPFSKSKSESRCVECGGTGTVFKPDGFDKDGIPVDTETVCPTCDGSGKM